MTSASSIEKPWWSDAVRQGASPTAQSTSARTPHDRHTTWWWLSPTTPFETRRTAARFDAAHESRRGERVQRPVHGLQGDMTHPLADPGRDGLDLEVITAADGLEQSHPSGRHPEPAPRNSSAVVGVWDALTASNLPP
jgi:hypothetical protein